MIFTAVVLTGGPSRQEKTIQALNALNNQSHPEVEKILVSNGRTENEIGDLYAVGALNMEWKIIRFPVNTFIRGDLGSVWRFPGAAAMMEATGRYIFFQSDDDFLAVDFFSRMNLLFSKYPEALTGSGLPVSWLYQTKEKILPGPGAWKNRPEFELGRELLNKYFVDGSYHPNPGFSLVCRTDLVAEFSDSIFEAGFPDYNPLIQLAIQGPTVFDASAHMYWGRHSGQDHFEWDRRNVASGLYNRAFREIEEINLKVLSRILPDARKEQKLIKTYLRNVLAAESFKAMVSKLSISSRKRRSENDSKRIEIGSRDFAYFLHLQNIVRTPRGTLILFFNAAKNSIKRRI